jgi:tetratricopeptide (TPR) repeat protein
MNANTHAALIQRGISFHNQRAFLEAERCYQTVLRNNPKNTDALNLMGVLAIEANRNDLALDFFRKAVKLAPQIAMYRNNLGNALSGQTDLREALPHLHKAVELDPCYLDALCNLGKAYRLLGDTDTAISWFNKALVIDQSFLRAKAGLAEVDSELGRFEEAVAAFEDILAKDPLQVEAFCGLALARKFEKDDPWIARYEDLLAIKTLRGDQLAPLHHAFAKICNDIGRYDDAFAHFTIGKKYKNAQFDPERLEQGYRHSALLFTPAFFAERAGWGLPDERPIFVVGLPRSGTTLTEQILSSHPQIEGLGELPDMRKVAQKLDYGVGDPKHFVRRVKQLKKADVRKLAQTYLQAYAQSRKPGVLRLVDKSPHNYELLGLIALLFPKAQVMFCRRDPMDNCVAIYMQNFNDSHGYNRSLQDLGRYWRAYRLVSEELVRQVPLRITQVDYETTVAEPEAAARRIVDGTGLPWDDACLRFYETERSVRTPSRWQVRQPIYSSSVGRWKRYEKHLGPLQAELAKDRTRP